MKCIFLMVIAMMLSLASGARESIRINYAYYYKNNVQSKNYKAQMDMTLDFDGKSSLFYSESFYKSDSLSYEYERHGRPAEILAEMSQYNSAYTEATFADYSASGYKLYFRVMRTGAVGEGGVMEMPQWTFLPDSMTVSGYSCKKAVADYMGREWTVWYTEEIPVSAGPWLLYGCPGLIVHAVDGDGLFKFQMLGAEYISDSRYENFDKFYRAGGNVRNVGVADEEKLKFRAKTDMDFMIQMINPGSSITVRDRNGNVEEGANRRDYIPIIPQSYWK